jgi:hypothetical protein
MNDMPQASYHDTNEYNSPPSCTRGTRGDAGACVTMVATLNAPVPQRRRVPHGSYEGTVPELRSNAPCVTTCSIADSLS